MNVHVPYTQAGRMMSVFSLLGEDVLLLEHLAIDEASNGLFTIQAQVKSQRDDLKASDLIGSTVDFSLKLKDDGTRWWNGFVTDLHQGSLTSRGTRSYALTLRPKLWTLSQKSDCRIFRNTTAAQIVEMLLVEHGITDFDLRITQKEMPFDYSVQWNETDLAYMLRRMQQMGLFYWFEHARGKHTMIVADHHSGYRDSSEPEVRFTEGSPAQDYISQWRLSYAYTPGRRTGRDWNFLAMGAPQGEQTNLNIVPGSPAHELYEYPGRFDDSWSGEQAMKYRIQATETGFETVEAASTVRTLAPGRRFTPQDVAKPDNVFAQQVVTAIRHEASDRTYETNGGMPSYANTFTVMPATTPATPHRTIPQPQIVGSQIALIAGPQGEEIFCDRWGRVKVWFPWDRRAVKDGSDTCWIRVGQPWAGGTWGHQVIPRVGMECLISYQDGDPDRPFVTALVPDPTNPTPYPLPDNKTRMTFRSNSYKSTGFNEMTFEDATGAENMFFHAQKDHTTKIENNKTNSVGNNHSNVVGANQALTVGGDKTEEIGGSHNLIVGGTGAGTAALMTPFAGMAGITADLLAQALAVEQDTSPGGGEPPLAPVPPELLAALSAATSAQMAPLAGCLTGLLSPSGCEAQGQVWNGPSPRPDAGTALARAGSLFGQATNALFQLPGMRNHITGTMKVDHCGCARVEQVGRSKVTHVGSSFATKVGSKWSLIAGKEANIKTGRDFWLTTGENIMMHAGHSISAVADDSIYIAAKDDVTISGKTVTIAALESITLQVGENSSITLDKNGMISLQASNTISLQASDTIASEAAKVVGLKGGSATFTVGPEKVLSDPEVAVGSNWGVVETSLKLLVEGTPWLGKVKFLKEGAGYIGKQIDKSWVGKKINRGVDTFEDYMINGYKAPDGSTYYPGGTVVHPDGSVDMPMPMQ